MLVYDDDYRIARDMEKFPWGTYSPYLRDLCLRGYAKPTIASQQPKSVAKSNGLGKKHIKNHIQSPSVESTIGGGGCDYGQKCNYRHVCEFTGCGANHPIYKHEANK